MGRPIVFVVSADVAVSDSVKALVESAGLAAEMFRSLQMFLEAVAPDRRGCLVLDAHIQDFRDPQWQASLAAAYNRMPGLLITDRGDVPTAVRAVKAGAVDVVQKPYREQNLLDAIISVLQADAAAQRGLHPRK